MAYQTHTLLSDAVREAAARETIDGTPRYVVKTHNGSFLVVDDAPLIGEWYSSDGVRHG